MKINIVSRWDSSVLFTAEAASILLALEAAIKSGADLRGADLRSADLRSADLRSANLDGANLDGAVLYGAVLRSADLRGAVLCGADLRGVNLGGANLCGANLCGANLRGANLDGANLDGANLDGANLDGAKNAELAQAYTVILPEGDLVGWKKCRNGVIVKLLIPQKAKRSNATGRKCRAEYAQVLRVFGAVEGISQHDSKIVYREGETIKANTWDDNRFNECSGGIHFFITRVEAEKH